MRTAAVAAMLAVGCDSDRMVLIPEAPEAVDWVALLFEDAAGALIASSGLERRDPSGRFRLLAPSEASDAVKVMVAGYRDIDLEPYAPPGVDEASAARVRRAKPEERALPRPEQVACGAFDGSLTTTSSCETDARLTTAWLEACPDPCDFFDPASLRLVAAHTGGATVSVALALDDAATSALVVVQPARLFRVTATAALELTALSTSAADSIGGGFRRDDGEIWLVASDGRLFAGRPETGFREAAPRPDGVTSSITRAAGSPRGPPEAFVADNFGALLRWDGRGWTEITRPSPEHTGQVDLEWLGEDRVVAVRPKRSEVLFYAAGEVRIDSRLLDPRAALQVPSLGLVVMTAAEGGLPFSLSLLRDGQWEPLPIPRATIDVGLGLWPLGSGFLFGGLRGVADTYQPGLGNCGPEVLASFDVKSVVTLEAAVMLVPFFSRDAERRTLISVFDRAYDLPSAVGCGLAP